MTETFETVRYTADVVCVRATGQGPELLTIRRGWPPHQGRLALPGGHVDPGETARAAAARELFEETGVLVAPARLILVGLFDEPDRDPRGRYISAAYVVVVGADTTTRAGTDAAEVRWVPLDDPGPLAFDHNRIAYLARRDQLFWLRSRPVGGV
ncbi:NUDIX hydrolase [Streptomyces cacaoi]|uniref:NUDIX hydrolase n=1 Tax=Streptomyces cacaoi TaxID=1898 RepID=UPI00261EA05C|nr:NUDIX hydrolase [Streptomyces cacaoi]